MGLWDKLKALFTWGRPRQPDPAAMPESMQYSLVALLSDLPYVDGPLIEQALSSVLNESSGNSFDTKEMHVAFEEAHGIVSFGGWVILINAVDDHYFGADTNFADQIPELRRKKAVEEHTAWMSVDVMLIPEQASPVQALALAGKLLAALVPTNALALIHPYKQLLCPYTVEVGQALEAGAGLEAFEADDIPVPIAQIDSEDPRMIEAVSEAQERFPEFIKAMKKRGPKDTFCVKVPFTDTEEEDAYKEFMWISVREVSDTHITGRLDNEPTHVKSIRLGQLVRIPRHKLNDWLYVINEEMTGGFTLKLLNDQLKPSRD
jgi:uncharacterized protein YegJ (DUF2314 family)